MRPLFVRMNRWAAGALALTLLIALPSSVKAAGPDCAAQRQDEVTCLACNIYHESRGQPELGQLAVAMVTVNRLRSPNFPKTICNVVWEKGIDYRTGRMVAQFSWTLDDRPDVVLEPAAWESAKSIAARALATLASSPVAIPDPSAGALYFHADYVTPDWSEDPALRLATRIGNHLFYRRSKDAPPVALAALPRVMASNPVPSTPMDPDLLQHPAHAAVQRGAKLISLSRSGPGGFLETKVHEGMRTRIILVRREP
nr:cell wall hydrolase [Azospirillum soli]